MLKEIYVFPLFYFFAVTSSQKQLHSEEAVIEQFPSDSDIDYEGVEIGCFKSQEMGKRKKCSEIQ